MQHHAFWAPVFFGGIGADSKESADDKKDQADGVLFHGSPLLCTGLCTGKYNKALSHYSAIKEPARQARKCLRAWIGGATGLQKGEKKRKDQGRYPCAGGCLIIIG